MKTIQPVTVWFNGQEVEATILNIFCSSDNLQSQAVFQYQLMQQVPTPNPEIYPPFPMTVVQNQLTMMGDAYDAWDTNDYAYEWIAEQLNLTITGEYVPPTPPLPPVPQTTTSTTTEAPSTTSTTTTKKA